MSSSTIKSRKGLIAKRAGLTVALALGAMAVVPAIASAATVTNSGTTIIYTAAGGETNNLTVTSSGTDTYTFNEASITIVDSASNCTATSGNVTCTSGGAWTAVTVNLNDNDDAFTAAGVNGDPFTINGGDDDDGNITGSSADDIINGDDTSDNATATGLSGGPGNDIINGGAGTTGDLINGGTGHDHLYGGTEGADDINGGDGNDRMDGGQSIENDDYDGGNDIDRVLYGSLNPPGAPDFTYTCTAQPINLDMDNNGDDDSCADAAKDTENVRDTVESVTGSSTADLITGSCQANTFSGDGPTADGTPENGSPGGNDTLTGDPASCAVTTTAGTEMDFFGGGEGSDTYDGDGSGNDGFDTVTYGSPYVYAAGENISVTIGGAADNDGWGNAAENVQSDIERVIGNSQNDTINATGYVVTPVSGSEVGQLGVQLFGRLGDDTLTDSPGNDTLNGEGNTTSSPGDTINCPNGGTDVAHNEETGGVGCES